MTLWNLHIFLCRYFHVCDGSLIPDIMHDILEGALQYEVKVMLQAMISEDRYFTLGIVKVLCTKIINVIIFRQFQQQAPVHRTGVHGG